MTLRPCATRSRVARNTRSISGLLSVAVGSSRISRRASRTSSRAISTSWRSPIESVSTGVPSCTWRRPSWSSTLARALRQAPPPVEERAVQPAEEDVVLDAQLGDEAELLVDEGDPVRLRVLRVPERELLALEADLPSSGRTSPTSVFTSVLLPAPLCPQTACTSPARTSSESPRTARTGPKDFERPTTSSTTRAAGGSADRRTGSGRRVRIPFAVQCGGAQATARTCTAS